MTTAFFIFLTTLSLWALKPCHGAVTMVKPETSVISNDIAASNTEHLFSPHLHDVIVGIYKRNFNNFPLVLSWTEISDDNNFKTDVLLGLYYAMRKVQHAAIDLHAIDLYNKIEALINATNDTNIDPVKLQKLQRFREELLVNTIVSESSHILESAAYMKCSSTKGSLFQKLLDILLVANETVSNLTFGLMVSQLRWKVPMEELTPLLANLSPHIKQNVDFLLSLYNEGPFEEKETSTIFFHLMKLKKSLNEAETKATKRIQKIDAIIPIELQLFFLGTVCIYKKDEDGKRFYIRECTSGYEVCFIEYSISDRKAAFKVEKKHNSLAFNFRSVAYDGRLLSINKEQSPSTDFDVYSATSTDNYDIDWRVNSSDEKVVFENMDGTKFLCASTAYRNAYTRSRESFLLKEDECKWFVEDCSHLVV